MIARLAAFVDSEKRCGPAAQLAAVAAAAAVVA